MSCRNYMIVKTDSPNNSLDSIKNELIELAKRNSIGIHFNIVGYQDELLELLDIKDNYFCISDDFEHVECEDTFDLINDSYDYMISLNLKRKKERIMAEQNYLMYRLSFLNEIVDLIFQKLDNTILIEFYFSDQYSSTLDDYKENLFVVQNRNLTAAFAQLLQPTKKEDFWGLKTGKFIIK